MAGTLRSLSELGHEVRVLVDESGLTGKPEDLQVVARPTRRQIIEHYQWADIVFTQLASRNRAMRWGALQDRPVVHFLHMGGVDPRTCLGIPDLLVFNAEWLRRATPWPGVTCVLHPPVDCARLGTTRGEAVTLVNLSDLKGGPLFFELARARPDLPFLGVLGAWGDQAIPEEVPQNVTLIDGVDDMREVFRRTRVLLVPSRQETFGRVGLEASCSGIPTIATPLPGIREALDDAALYADRSDIDAWLDLLERLDDAVYYEARSRVAEARARAFDARGEVRELERLLREIVIGARR